MKIIENNRKRELVNYINNYSCIYVYGAGMEAKKKYSLLCELGINIHGFLVTDKTVNIRMLNGKEVFGVTDEFVDKKALIIIGVSQKFEMEVLDNLKKYNFKNVLHIQSPVEIWKVNRGYPKLEITAKIGCKIQCKYCPQSLLYKEYFRRDINRQREITFEEYKLCISNMPKETIISFAGFVEPFFHKDGVEMIKYAHETGHTVELFTTLQGVTKKQFDQIKDIPYRQVVLHTPDIMNYANIPIDEEYINILDEALDMSKPDGTPFFDSANCQSEPSEEFLKIAKGRIKVESVLVDRAGNLDDDNLKSCSLKKGRIICNRSKNQNHWVLLPDGEVVLCCMDFGLTQQLGNLKKSTYEQIIESDTYKQVIKEMNEFLDDKFICRKCTSSTELKL